MLDVSAKNLLREVEVAKGEVKDRLKAMDAMVGRFVGPAFNVNRGNGELEPENMNYEFLSRMLAKVAFRNPYVDVNTKRVEPEYDVQALALEHFANRWNRDFDFEETMVELATDFLFTYGVAHIANEPIPGEHENPDPLMMPGVYRLDPKTFFWDPLAKNWGTTRFVGHYWVRDKDDLEAEAKKNPDEWNLDVIQELAEGTGLDEFRDQTSMEAVNRGEILGFDVYIPDHQIEGEPGPEEGYNGAIFTLGVGQDGRGGKYADYLRPPRMYYGPRGGPYELVGCYKVPNEVTPLGPMAAMEGQVQELNDVSRTMSESIKRHKNLILYDEADTDTAEALNEAEHDFWVGVPNLAEGAGVAPMQVGGITDQHAGWRNDIKQVLREVAGLSESHSGNAASDTTATAEAIANDASEDRTSFMAGQFRKSMARIYRKLLWYPWHDDSVVMELGGVSMTRKKSGRPDSDDDQNKQNMLWVGGEPGPERLQELRGRFPGYLQGQLPRRPEETDPKFIEGSGQTYDDLEIDIDPFSMARPSEALRRAQAQELDQLVLALLPILGPAAPSVISRWLSIRSELTNLPQLKEIFGPEMEQMATQAILQGMQGESQRPSGPRFSRFGGQAPTSLPFADAKRVGLPGQSAGGEAAGAQPAVGMN